MMSFLRINKLLKYATSQRNADRFPPIENDFEIIEESNTHRCIFVFNHSLSKTVLRHESTEVYDFLYDSLNFYGIDDFPVLKRLCSSLPIFLKLEKHSAVRKKYDKLISRSIPRCVQLFKERLKSIFLTLEDVDEIDVNYWASLLASSAMETLCTAIFPANLKFCFEPAELESIDFFNTFPTKTLLNNSENLLQKYDSFFNFDSSPEGVIAASIVTMGYMPLKALFATLMNDFISDGFKLTSLSAYNVVPTNFVMRRISSSFELNYTSFNNQYLPFSFRAGDIAYVFLANGGGCPFSNKTSIPWGFGKHTCPGKTISEQFLKMLSSELQLLFSSNSTSIEKNIKYANIENRKSTAFLRYY